MIPCKTIRKTILQPTEVDQITFVVKEDQIREWITEKLGKDLIGPANLILPKHFELAHYFNDGDADIEVTFNVQVK